MPAKLKFLDRCSLVDAQATSSMTVAFGERHRGQVPLNFDEGGFNVRRFATKSLIVANRG